MQKRREKSISSSASSTRSNAMPAPARPGLSPSTPSTPAPLAARLAALWPVVWPAIVIAAIGLIPRALIWLTYTPWMCFDTASYLRLANCMVNGDWPSSLGWRPPGYPLLMTLATGGLAATDGPGNIVLCQMAMGVATAMLVYVIVLWALGDQASGDRVTAAAATADSTLGAGAKADRAADAGGTNNRVFFDLATGARRFALAAGVFDALCVNRAMTEITLLSESLTCFILTFTALTFLSIARRPDKSRVWQWAALGLLAAGATLTRPNNLFLLPFLAGWLWVVSRGSAGGEGWKKWVAFAAPGCAPILAWCLMNLATFGYFGPVTTTGYNLANKTIDFVDQAPDQFAPLRDVLEKYSGQKMPGVPRDSRVWFALDELQRLPGDTSPPGPARFVEVSNRLMKMDLWLIEHRPLRYLRAVAEASVRFWFPSQMTPVLPTETTDPSAPDGGNVVRSPGLQSAIYVVSLPMAVAVMTVYVVFLLASATVAITVTAKAIAIAIAALPKSSRRVVASNRGAGSHRIDASNRNAASDRDAPADRDAGSHRGAASNRIDLLFLLTFVLLADFSCAAIEYGNGRFPLPYQPLIVASAFIACWQAWRWARRRG